MVETETKIFYVLGILAILLYGPVHSATCRNYNVESINVCQDIYIITRGPINLYHEITQPTPYATSCKCNVNFGVNNALYVALDNVPDANCGSSIVITQKVNVSKQYIYCPDITRKFSNYKHAIDVTVHTDVNATPSLFCLFLELKDFGSSNITVSCISLLTTTASTMPARSRISTNGTTTSGISPKGKQTTYSQLHVIIPVAVGGVFLVFVVVIVMIVCIRKGTLVKYRESETKTSQEKIQELHQYDNKGMENDGDENKVTVYETYDDDNKKHIQHHFEDVGSGYSEVGLVQSTEHRKDYHAESGYSEIGFSSKEQEKSKYSDGGYSEVVLQSNEKRSQNLEDISGAYDEVNLSSAKSDESIHGPIKHENDDNYNSSKRRDFPVYAMPNKVSKIQANTDGRTDPFPVYALPHKKKNQEGQKKNSSKGTTKPIIKQKPTTKPEKLQPKQEIAGVVNVDGLKYTDLQLQEENYITDQSFIPREKTEYAEIL